MQRASSRTDGNDAPGSTVPFLQAPARRSCDVLDALPKGRDKEGFFLYLNFALPFWRFSPRCRPTGYEAAPDRAKGFPLSLINRFYPGERSAVTTIPDARLRIPSAEAIRSYASIRT